VHQPLDGEALQPVIGKRGNLGLVDAKVTNCFGLGEAPPLQNLADRIRQADLGLALLGVGEPQVGKDVPELGVTIGSFSFSRVTLLAVLAGLLQSPPLAPGRDRLLFLGFRRCSISLRVNPSVLPTERTISSERSFFFGITTGRARPGLTMI